MKRTEHKTTQKGGQVISDMPEDSTEYLIDRDLKPLIEKVREKAIQPEYRHEWSDNDILGLIVSKFGRWDFENIQEICGAAMEDANFRPEAKIVREMADGGSMGSLEVANTIREQIGGKDLYMLGAYNLVGDSKSLAFKFTVLPASIFLPSILATILTAAFLAFTFVVLVGIITFCTNHFPSF